MSNDDDYKPIKAVKIDFEHFSKYVDKHGIDRAQGYYDALKEVFGNIDGFFYKKHMSGTWERDTPYQVDTKLCYFRLQSDRLLKDIRKTKILKRPTPE